MQRSHVLGSGWGSVGAEVVAQLVLWLWLSWCSGCGSVGAVVVAELVQGLLLKHCLLSTVLKR